MLHYTAKLSITAKYLERAANSRTGITGRA